MIEISSVKNFRCTVCFNHRKMRIMDSNENFINSNFKRDGFSRKNVITKIGCLLLPSFRVSLLITVLWYIFLIPF